MSLTQEVDVLRRLPLFSQVAPNKLKLLAFTSERITFEAGQVLLQQGELGDNALIILEGEADVFIETPDRVKVATVGPSQIVGEISILCDIPRTATVAAQTNVTALRIQKELFLQMLAEFPGMATAIMRELATRMTHTMTQLRQAHQSLHDLQTEKETPSS